MKGKTWSLIVLVGLTCSCAGRADGDARNSGQGGTQASGSSMPSSAQAGGSSLNEDASSGGTSSSGGSASGGRASDGDPTGGSGAAGGVRVIAQAPECTELCKQLTACAAKALPECNQRCIESAWVETHKKHCLALRVAWINEEGCGKMLATYDAFEPSDDCK